ncbi:MAG TPA: hypothetical protein VGF54_16365 [Streptosporangiaceae bacterium]|jgi:hypothetical protein
MMAFIRPRLRKPLGYALAGTVFAVAWALRGGHAWWLSVAMEVTVLGGAVGMYLRAGEDNDEGALAGSRADERQKLLSLRSRALGWNFAMVTAFIGVTVAVAVKAAWWWPFLVILAVTGFAYLLGLSNYGVAEEGTADEADTGHQGAVPGQPVIRPR